jgi:ABC-type lipoprotein export system ATPase subunit
MDSTYKPNLLQNKPLPLAELSADSFEDFVYQSLVILGNQKGFKMQSGRQPSGDEGFDCTAKTTNNELVCIQCKRYNDTLYTVTVVEEIVKVALNGILDNAIPQYHYIISSGSVSTKLRKQLRQNGYSDIKEECKKLLNDKKKQLTLIKKLEEKSIDPYSVICDYLDSLQDLIVWSGVDFQNELVVIWSQLNDILEKHFSLAIVFKEHPRPDFSLSDYLKNKNSKKENLVPLNFQQASLPNNLKVEENQKKSEKIVWSINDIISSLKDNQNILISSPGGSGKSSALLLIEEELVNTSNDIEYVPVRINLRSYSRNTLNQKINQELNINYGSWKSLPFKFIFLFDAIDEMLQYDTQAFIDELSSIINGYSFILTIRNTGLNIETTIPFLDYCISVQPLSYRSAFQMAEKIFKNEELKVFYDEYRSRLSSIGFNFLSSPFVLSMTIDYYKINKTIPEKIEDILENWIQSKIKSDATKVKDTINKINKIPAKYIEKTFSLILYKSRIERNLFSIPNDSFDKIIFDCYNELSSSNLYIKSLDIQEFVSMISHYEILVLEDDKYYLTPHSIISDYLIAKEFAKNWKKHIENSLINSMYDIWLYSSNFIKDDEKDEFLLFIMSFNLSLGAKISKKFGISFIEKVEKTLLEYEQSEQVLKRSEAIHALGILGTNKSLERLRSKTDCIDYHHSWQRLRSLAEHGDKETLYHILKENEQQAQAPIKISGGTYDIWFHSPPAVITDIARNRLKEWLDNKKVPLSFCLETIALFGDSHDIDILVLIVESTQIHKEFFLACKALNVINPILLIDLLKKLIKKKHFFSHEAKEVLLSLGIESNIDDEINYFIEQCNKPEIELAQQDLMYALIKLSEFIEKFKLNDLQINRLIETYKKLDFPYDFYIYRLFWSIALKNKIDDFMPLVIFAFERNHSEEIHLAIGYLVSFDEINISNELSKKIDDYFPCVEEKSYGLKINYAKYYLKRGKKDIAYKIIYEDIEKLLINLSPETITYEKYNFSSFLSSSIVFNYFELVKDIKLDESIALKLLLINTNHTPKEDKIKKEILSKININKIEDYANRIENIDVKIYVSDYLLKNNFVLNPLELFKQYLPIFLSHHMYYDTIQKVCIDNWNDELANIFLSNFHNHRWTQIDVQMFDKYIGFYAEILTKTQLEKFEEQWNKPINPLVKRIHKIWLEYNGLG